MTSNGLISGVFAASESNSAALGTHYGLDLHRRNCGRQITHAHQVVSRAGESKDPIHPAHAAMPQLAHQRNRLQPAETFFDPLPLSLADGITLVPRRSSIDRAAAAPFVVLRHVRRHPQISTLLHKVSRVKPLVAAHRHRPGTSKLLQHDQRGIALRRAVGLKDLPESFMIFKLRALQAPAGSREGLSPLLSNTECTSRSRAA